MNPKLAFRPAKSALHIATGGAVLGALLSPPAWPAASEETFGRLFFTPEQRQSLDRELQNPGQGRAHQGSTLVINGLVARSSGKRTFWVNGRPQHETQRQSGVLMTTRADDPAAITVVSELVSATQARVGATVNLETAQASDLIEVGRVEVSSRPGAGR